MSQTNRLSVFVFSFAIAVGLAGCGQLQPASAPALELNGIPGTVHGGQQPISGAGIQLYAVGTTADGSASNPLLTSTVTTNANGGFSTGSFSCPTSTTLVYLLASGGNPGLANGTNNSAIQQIALLGQCGSLGPSTFISLNEVTTVAALSAVYPYFTAPAAIGSGSTDVASLTSAFTLAQQLANTSTGQSPGTGVPSGYTVPTQEIYSLADIIASCINTSGGVAGDGSACGDLFTYATPPGGTSPTDVATALTDILNNATYNLGSLFNLPAPSAPFQPSLSSAPYTWKVWLNSESTVTYAANSATSGSVPVDGNQYSSGATVTVLGNSGSLAESGYTFVGWNTVADGSGAGYAPGATFTIGGYNQILYAQFANGGQYTVTYSGNGNTGGAAPNDSNSYSPGSLVTVLGNSGSLVRTGYTFTGWNTRANGAGISYSSGNSFTIDALSQTLYAQWQRTGTTYTMTYAGNGATSGFVTSDPGQYETGDTVTVYGNLGFFFRPGYVFTGWNTATDGSGTAYAIGATFTMGSANVVLFAQWTSADWPPVSIWGGAREVITLLSDGTVWDWGLGSSGQLGDNNTTNIDLPTEVLGPGGSGYLNDIIALSGGEQHNAALKNDGTVWAWGNDQNDQLGDGGGANKKTPIQVNGLSSVVMLNSRGYHSVAVKSDGTVWDWGWDEYGALGNGLSLAQGTTTYTTPLQVRGVNNPIMVSAGFMYNIALMPDHTLLTWGNNNDAESGNGTVGGYLSAAEPVVGINDLVWVSAGWIHSVAIRSDGTVWTWGENYWNGAFSTCPDSSFCGYGMIGNGTTNEYQYTPQQVQGLSGTIMALSADSSTTVLLRDGTVWTFGSNGAGQLGVPNIDQSLVPVQVQGLCQAVYIMARDFHNEAICTDGSLWSWGSGTSGELGNGAFNNSAVPVQVTAY